MLVAASDLQTAHGLQSQDWELETVLRDSKKTFDAGSDQFEQPPSSRHAHGYGRTLRTEFGDVLSMQSAAKLLDGGTSEILGNQTAHSSANATVVSMMLGHLQ